MPDLLKDLDFFTLTNCSAPRSRWRATPSSSSSSAKCCRTSSGILPAKPSPRELVPQMAELGYLRRQSQGLRMRRDEQRRLRPDHAGARGGRLGPALVRLGAERAVDVRDLCLRHRGTEAALLAGDGQGQADRMLRADRARPRLRPGRDGDARRGATATDGFSTAPSAGSPTARSPTSRSCGRRSTRASPASWSRRARPDSRTRDIHGKFSMRASITSELIFEDVRTRRRRAAAEARGLQGAARLPDAGALRNRMGRDRRGAQLLPMRAGLHQIAQAVLASAGRLSDGAAQAGRRC